MFKTLTIAALSVAALAQYPYYPQNQFGAGNTINRLNNVENRKLVNIHNAVDRNIGYGNCGLKRELKNELTGIVTQGTNQLNSLALNGGSSFGYY
jgi:hypothetical protein